MKWSKKQQAKWDKKNQDRMIGHTVNSEEDAKAKGIDIKVKQGSQRDRSPIRYFKSYTPEAV